MSDTKKLTLEDITETANSGAIGKLSGVAAVNYQDRLDNLVFELALELHQSYFGIDGDLTSRHISVAAGLVKHAAEQLQRKGDI